MKSHTRFVALTLLVGVVFISFAGGVVSVHADGGPIIVVDGIGADDWNPNLKVMDDVNEPGVPDGYDIKALYQYYDGREGWDTLYFRYDVYGIAGDSDDDGNPHTGTYWTDRWGVSADELYCIFLDTDLDNNTGWRFPGIEGGFDLRIEYTNNTASIMHFTPTTAFLAPGTNENALHQGKLIDSYLKGLLIKDEGDEEVEVTAAIKTTSPYNDVVEIGVSGASKLFTPPASPRYYRLYGYADYYKYWVGGEDYLENELDIRAPELNFTAQDICCYNISFNGTTDLELANCTWEFGDGNKTYCSPPCMNTTHQYAAGGYYKVNFSGYRSNGMYGFTQKQIYVDRGPTVLATANQTHLGVPSWVELNGTGSHADPLGNRSITYTWSFDDWHDSMTGEVVTILVNTTVNATLTVFDGHCYNETTLMIEYDPVPPDLDFTTEAICCHNQSFTATTNATLK
ncbi:MAG: hypothetical protein ACXQS6_04145, partial [Candidatus Syntropharchaeales archaeon]